MNSEQLAYYEKKRAEIKNKYKKAKLKNSLLILGSGLAVLIVVILLHSLLNIAVTLVLSAMIIMFCIIFLRIRIVTINHTMQGQLQQFEQEDPDFYA